MKIFMKLRLPRTRNLRRDLQLTLICSGVLFLNPSFAAFAMGPWSTDAHNDLIDSAFPEERSDCLLKIKEGSAWVDEFQNQGSAHSFMHAMRSADQTVPEAKKLAADYIQDEYAVVTSLLESSTVALNGSQIDGTDRVTNDQMLITDMDSYLGACMHRGRALHTVMDSTSPVHAGYAIWSPTDLLHIFEHGDFKYSLENEEALINNPALKIKTVGLMQVVQRLYINAKLKDYRFE